MGELSPLEMNIIQILEFLHLVRSLCMRHPYQFLRVALNLRNLLLFKFNYQVLHPWMLFPLKFRHLRPLQFQANSEFVRQFIGMFLEKRVSD